LDILFHSLIVVEETLAQKNTSEFYLSIYNGKNLPGKLFYEKIFIGKKEKAPEK
jgi:hypothetical protein